MLDHETIRSFIKVAECQSFSRAAELLHKTTATISYRIKTLEESIGTQLFIRTTRSVNLTPQVNTCWNVAANGTTGSTPCPMSYARSMTAWSIRSIS